MHARPSLRGRRGRFSLVALFMACLLAAGEAGAGSFPPLDAKRDWIQLASGEWLKGELRSLYNHKLEFQSEQLSLQTLDWDAVKTVRTARPQAVRYEVPGSAEPVTAYGILVLEGGTATVGTGAGAVTIARERIVAIATGTRREADYWSGQISIGANVRSGNTDVADASVIVKTQRRRAASRFVADYLANTSRTAGVQTSGNHRLSALFDSFLTSRTYWRVFNAEYFRDRFQNIDRQVSLGTGIGHDVVRDANTEWDVSAGLGGVYKRYVSVQADSDRSNRSASLQLGSRLDTHLTRWLEYLLELRVQFVNERNGRYLQHLLTTLSTNLTRDLDLDVSLIWDRVGKPRPLEDGTVPEKDDYRFVVAVKYAF